MIFDFLGFFLKTGQFLQVYDKNMCLKVPKNTHMNHIVAEIRANPRFRVVFAHLVPNTGVYVRHTTVALTRV